MIDIIKVNAPGETGRKIDVLAIDGNLISYFNTMVNEIVITPGDHKENIRLHSMTTYDKDIFDRIVAHDYKELSGKVLSLSHIENGRLRPISALDFHRKQPDFEPDTLSVQRTWLAPRFEDDQQRVEYCSAFRKEIVKNKYAACSFSTDSFFIYVTLLVINYNGSPASSFAEIDAKIDQAHKTSFAYVESLGKEPEAVTVRFDFPQPVRTSCKQYLVYFGQFLEDIGVKVTTDLWDDAGDAGKVLFTITPDDPDQALHKIRTALDLYLSLPGMPSATSMPSMTGSYEVQRLELQVHNLRGQIATSLLAAQQQQAIIQAQKARAESQDVTIGVLKDRVNDLLQERSELVITQNVLRDSVQSMSVPSKPDEEVIVFHGLVPVGKITWLEKFGLVFDTPKFLKMIKEYMADPDWIEITTKDTDDLY